MSQPTVDELAKLKHVAHQLRETFSERGHHVEEAMNVDPAFGSGHARAFVARDLVVDAARQAASQVGLEFRTVAGGGVELRHLSRVDRRYRLRKAERASQGFQVDVSSDSALTLPIEPTLFAVELWVYCWTLSANGFISDVIVAPVVDHVAGKPGRLVLGEVISLEGPSVPSSGFVPLEEDLPGFEEDGQDGFVPDHEDGTEA